MKYLKKKQKEVPFCRNCMYLQERYNTPAITPQSGGGYYGYFTASYLYLQKMYVCVHPKTSICAPIGIGVYPPADYKSPKCPLRYISKHEISQINSEETENK